MLPARRTPCNPGSFFGKNYPRALGKLDEDSRLIKSPDAEMPNKPFLREISYAAQAQPIMHAKPPKASPQDFNQQRRTCYDQFDRHVPQGCEVFVAGSLAS